MQNPYHARKSGFTLLEILVVLAIVGILAGIFGVNYVQSIRRANLNEAAVNVAATLTRARSLAQRSSTDQAVSWTATTLTAGTQSLTIPNGARIATAAATGYTYTAPYGELVTPIPPGGTEPVGGLRLELVDGSGRWKTAVDAVGVTGKVIRRRIVAADATIQ